MPFAFWLPRLKKIIEMGGSFCKRASGTTINDPGGRCWRATAHFNR